MKKYLKIIILLAIILLICFGLWKFKNRETKSEIQNQNAVQEIKATLTVNDGSSVKSFDVSSFVGKTALSATDANTKIIVDGIGSDSFVTSINGRIADSKKHEFWELDANGAETQVGAGSYVINNGDSILWKITIY